MCLSIPVFNCQRSLVQLLLVYNVSARVFFFFCVRLYLPICFCCCLIYLIYLSIFVPIYYPFWYHLLCIYFERRYYCHRHLCANVNACEDSDRTARLFLCGHECKSLFEWPVCEKEWLDVVNVRLSCEHILDTIVDVVNASFREVLVPVCEVHVVKEVHGVE